MQHHCFIQIWKPIWSPGSHLEFWTSKFVTAISQQLLDGLFSNFVYGFPLDPSCATSLFYSDLKIIMATRQPSWILNIKVCYRYFSATTGWIFTNFCIRIPLGALVVQHHFFIQIWTKMWSSGGHLEFLNIKVCYRYFSATTGWIVSKFCIQIPLRT